MKKVKTWTWYLISRVQIQKREVTREPLLSKLLVCWRLLLLTYSWSTCGLKIWEDMVLLTMDFLRSSLNATWNYSVSSQPRSWCSSFVTLTIKEIIVRIWWNRSNLISILSGPKSSSLKSLKTRKPTISSTLNFTCFPIKFSKRINSISQHSSLETGLIKHLITISSQKEIIRTCHSMACRFSSIKLGTSLRTRRSSTCRIKDKWLPTSDVTRSNLRPSQVLKLISIHLS